MGHIALIFPLCCETNVISATLQSCSILVAKPQYIPHMADVLKKCSSKLEVCRHVFTKLKGNVAFGTFWKQSHNTSRYLGNASMNVNSRSSHSRRSDEPRVHADWIRNFVSNEIVVQPINNAFFTTCNDFHCPKKPNGLRYLRASIFPYELCISYVTESETSQTQETITLKRISHTNNSKQLHDCPLIADKVIYQCYQHRWKA